jgi:hypothetical protein
VFDTVTPPAFAYISGIIIVPFSLSISSAACVIGPFAASIIKGACILAAFEKFITPSSAAEIRKLLQENQLV